MNVRIAQLVTFNAGIWYNDVLEMNSYTAKLWMITQTYDTQEQSIAFQRMKHFVYTELDSTIFVGSELQDKCNQLTQAGLNVTTLPGAAVDQLIGIMLFHKLNAIMEGRIVVVEVEISAGDGVIYLHSENETSESIPQPDWWHQADLVHSELLSTADNRISIHPVATWRDLDLDWPSNTNMSTDSDSIVFADFKKNNETE